MTKKRILSILCSLVLVFGLASVASVSAKAEDNRIQPYGQYYANGTANIQNSGNHKVTIGGDTAAHVTVSKIAVLVYLQREVDGEWEYYLTRTATKTNASYVGYSETVEVEPGYYYRVVCVHYANSDSSSSMTDALYIE